MNGADVTALQRELERRNFNVGPYGFDGWYGPDTRAAVVAFQRSAGLIVSGVVDQTSWQLLGFR
jgi:peptidoglycan hydrolase-like protein with peptidoglycan-binding domain